MQTKEMAKRETKHLTLILTLPLMQTKEMAGREAIKLRKEAEVLKLKISRYVTNE